MDRDPLATVFRLLLEAGMAAADAMQIVATARRQWGGVSVYIARRDRKIQDAEIRERLAAGEQPGDIARKMSVCVRTIRRRRSDWL